MENKFKILFVCTGNTCRSPMAEGALRVLMEKERPQRTEIRSAGIAAFSGYPATTFAVEAAKMWNADISKHSSQRLTKELIAESDLILAMSPEHYDEIITISRDAEAKTYLFKNFPESGGDGENVEDPIGQSLDKYNETFLEIGEYLGKNLNKMLERVDSKQNV